jgi:tetratricopeptide (TPR) repeat protein
MMSAIKSNRMESEREMASELIMDKAVYQLIEQHCAQGDAHTEADAFELALASYQQAWSLLPDPVRVWEAATWIQIAIADVYFFSARYAEAEQALEYAQTCPGGMGNPYVDMRLGQVLLEQGEQEAAHECLLRAYQSGGEELFDGEEQKYRVW